MIRAVISDLDGTLLPHKGEISPRNLGTLRLIGEAGCIRIIATGRNLFSALRILQPDFPADYLVFSSGAGILRWKDRRLVFSRHLPEKDCRKIAACLWDSNVNFTVQREIPDNHLFYYTSNYPLHEDYVRRLEAYRPYGTPISSPDGIRGQATQFVVILDGQQLPLMEELRERLASYSVVRTTSPIDNRALWLEIFPPDVNKGLTCLKLLEQLDISPRETAGLGNDFNDTDFLDICAMAYVVDNAPIQLKGYYKSVASDRNDGFTDFISRTGLPAASGTG